MVEVRRQSSKLRVVDTHPSARTASKMVTSTAFHNVAGCYGAKAFCMTHSGLRGAVAEANVFVQLLLVPFLIAEK